jgi:hypothetical protein
MVKSPTARDHVAEAFPESRSRCSRATMYFCIHGMLACSVPYLVRYSHGPIRICACIVTHVRVGICMVCKIYVALPVVVLK